MNVMEAITSAPHNGKRVLIFYVERGVICWAGIGFFKGADGRPASREKGDWWLESAGRDTHAVYPTHWTDLPKVVGDAV